MHKKDNSTIITEYVPLKDYLFRYDRGAFWMGNYLLNPFEDKIQYFPSCIRNLLNFLPMFMYIETLKFVFSSSFIHSIQSQITMFCMKKKNIEFFLY